MKRIIKFRVFNEITGKMTQVKTMCGQYVWDFGIDPVYDSPEKMIDQAYDTEDKSHLMQFTGLLGKNKTEIFENDIVRYVGNTIVWQVCFDRWGIPALARVDYPMGIDFKEMEIHHNLTPNECVVLGNIWENPSLLGAKP